MNFNTLVTLLEQDIDLSNLDASLPYSDDIKKNRLTFNNCVNDFEHPELFEDYLHNVARIFKYNNFDHWLRYWLTPSELDENEMYMYTGFMHMLGERYPHFLKHPEYVDKIRLAKQTPHLKNDHGMNLTF